MGSKRILVLTGPTATGKTALGVALAETLDGEVISADSMQLYKLMDIGTAKPTAEEMRGVPHHMVDAVSPFESYSVSRYVAEAMAHVEDVLARGRLPIIVGGTGLYIDALIAGREFAPVENTDLRGELAARYELVGGEEMLAALGRFDAESAAGLHANDKARIVRAFEIFELTGRTKAQHDAATRAIPARYDAVRIALEFAERERLYARIDARVDVMMDAGLLAEVQMLLDLGLTREHTAMQAIGYRELAQALAGEAELADAVALVKQHSRQYAKRQLTWLRRHEDVRWISWAEMPDIDHGVAVSTKFLRETE